MIINIFIYKQASATIVISDKLKMLINGLQKNKNVKSYVTVRLLFNHLTRSNLF